MGAKDGCAGIAVAIVVFLASCLVGLPWIGVIILSIAGAVLALGKKD